jgi:hypothetical protein
MLTGYVLKLLAITVLYIYMWMDNKKRDREQAIDGSADIDEKERVRKQGIEAGMHDMTELDNRGFRYVL